MKGELLWLKVEGSREEARNQGRCWLTRTTLSDDLVLPEKHASSGAHSPLTSQDRSSKSFSFMDEKLRPGWASDLPRLTRRNGGVWTFSLGRCGFGYMGFHFLFPGMPRSRSVWRVTSRHPLVGFFPRMVKQQRFISHLCPMSITVGWGLCSAALPLRAAPSLWVHDCQRQEKGNTGMVCWLFHLRSVVKSCGYI